ncbi:MAG: trypsin-like peptidase domain-containing protein [Candidatus Anammoxibacter sp.]
MKIKIALFVGFTVCTILLTQNIGLAANDREKLRQDIIELEKSVKDFSLIFEKVAQYVGPSVVKINITRKMSKEVVRKRRAEQTPFFHPFPKPPIGDRFKQKELRPSEPRDNHAKQDVGSGVIINKNGYIITNYHVVHGYSDGNIEVILFNGEKFDAKIIGKDPKTDLAVLKIEGSDFKTADFADISQVHVGDWVIAIGSPFNYQQTVSAGIVSAIGRKHVNPNSSPFAYEDFIQTDAAVNPGNSGGPLVNLRGEIIGINAAIATRNGSFQGIAFAISAEIAEKVANDLIEKGKVSRGHIGVGMIDIDDKLAKTLGLNDSKEVLDYLGLDSLNGTFIAGVWDKTPASFAGLMPGDVILEMDNITIRNSEDLQEVIRNKLVNSIARIIIVRNREKIPIDIQIGEQPDDMSGIGFASIKTGTLRVGFGLTVRQLTPEVAESLEYDGENGILVFEVKKDSIAEKTGIEPGDIINKIGYSETSTTLKFYKDLYRFRKESKPITIHIYHKGFVTLISR